MDALVSAFTSFTSVGLRERGHVRLAQPLAKVDLHGLRHRRERQPVEAHREPIFELRFDDAKATVTQVGQVAG